MDRGEAGTSFPPGRESILASLADLGLENGSVDVGTEQPADRRCCDNWSDTTGGAGAEYKQRRWARCLDRRGFLYWAEKACASSFLSVLASTFLLKRPLLATDMAPVSSDTTTTTASVSSVRPSAAR